MDYKKLYDRIIDHRKKTPINDEYIEKHHIIPKSLGGDDSPENIIPLSAREHFICHYLLTKIYSPNTRSWYKMINAFIIMNAVGIKDRYINSRLYESRRTAFSITMSKNQRGDQNSQHGTKWIYNIKIKQSKKIPKGDPIPVGWKKGRVIDFDAHLEKEQIANERKNLMGKEKALVDKKEKERYAKLFTLFKNGEYSSLTAFVNEINFEYSRQSLIRNWKKYLGFPTLTWGRQFTSEDAKQL